MLVFNIKAGIITAKFKVAINGALLLNLILKTNKEKDVIIISKIHSYLYIEQSRFICISDYKNNVI